MTPEFYSEIEKQGLKLFASGTASHESIIDFREKAYDQLVKCLQDKGPEKWRYCFVDLFHYVEGAETDYPSFTCYKPTNSIAKSAWEWFSQRPFSIGDRIFRSKTRKTAIILTSCSAKSFSSVSHVDIHELDGNWLSQARETDPSYESFAPANTEAPAIADSIAKQSIFETSEAPTNKDGVQRFHRMLLYTLQPRDCDDCWLFYFPYWTGALKTFSGTVFGFTRNANLSSSDEEIVQLVHFLKGISDHWARFAHLHRERSEINLGRSKAAKAAVFARNFSHITGSHVISNPEFRHSLAGDDLMRGFRKRFRESHQGFVEAENNLFQFMLEKAYKVENLWTAGTKVLADARDEMGTGGRLMENTRRFHEYLQGRFDFIARAIDDTQDQPEPLWFVKDLVEGFLSQTAYLDTLVADVGLRRKDMEFFVKLPDGSGGTATFLAEWKLDAKTEALMVDWKAVESITGKIGDYATLVALPGGMVSAHAFYSLLENIIRNSAKYGSLKELRQKAGTPYRITLELKRADGHFELRIWDNYSGTQKKDDKGNWVLDQIGPLQKRLEQDFVKPTGEQETDNLGMMEMQACAQMLFRGDERGLFPGDKPKHVCAAEKDSVKRKKKAARFNLWTEEEDYDRKADGHFLLTYHLTLNVPVLLGVLQRTGLSDDGARKISRHFANLDEVQKAWPHLLVLNGDELRVDDDLPKKLTAAHWQYPYRTLVLYSKSNANGEDDHTQCRLDGEQAPKHRVPSLVNECLHEKVFSALPAEPTEAKRVEETAILAAYEAWLRAWKGEPAGGQWHLWIGMERPLDQVKEGWASGVTGFNQKPCLIRVGVRSFSGGQAKDLMGSQPDDEAYRKPTEKEKQAVEEKFKGEWEKAETAEQRYWLVERAAAPNQKRALVLDNHGNCFPGAYSVEKETDLSRATRFYQKLSGTVSPDLFRTLSRPPSDEFGFAFFIYSLVESCLTNIAVVDERVAWNLIEGGGGGTKNDHFAEHLAEHQKAGVFPVFRFRQKGATPEAGFYNARHRDLVRQCVPQADALNDEGVTFDASTSKQSKIQFLSTRKQASGATSGRLEVTDDPSYAPDVLLIHEGAMDILTSEQEVKWKHREDGKGAEEEYLKALYPLAPAIVRTSGRGRKSKLLGEHLPFIEFGEVSSALLTARNKFSLVRGLLGSAGEEKKP